MSESIANKRSLDEEPEHDTKKVKTDVGEEVAVEVADKEPETTSEEATVEKKEEKKDESAETPIEAPKASEESGTAPIAASTTTTKTSTVSSAGGAEEKKYTFGGSSFKFNASNGSSGKGSVFGSGISSFGKPQSAATPDKAADSSSKDPKSETTTQSSPKTSTGSTFGSKPGSSFGSGFGSSFGSNSKFGDAFQNSLKKKSFLDDNAPKEKSATPADEKADTTKDEAKETEPGKKDEANETGEADDSSISTPPPQQYKQIDLAQVKEIKTGEENEVSRFNSSAKLFELNLTKISEGWKERGLGQLHLNQSKNDPQQLRLVMRSQGLLRVILNMKIQKETNVMKGLEASLSPGKYLRLNSIGEEGLPVQYLLKFGSQNTRDELYTKISELKEDL